MPRDLLRDIVSQRHQAGILIDFDGTLSEIAPSPEQARPLGNAASTLEDLASVFRVVAVVSGRRAREVAEVLGANVRYFGLYGREDGIGEAGSPVPSQMEHVFREAERAVADIPGARVEDKGVQLAVHYRGASDHEAAAAVLRDRLGRIAGAYELVLLEGKRVLELAPKGGPTKGDVVVALAEEAGLRFLLYAGDDIADLGAFAAIDRLADSGLAGVKVAVRSAETPQILLHAADIVVEGPAGLIELLHSLIDE